MKKSVRLFIEACAKGYVSEGAIRGIRRTLNHSTATPEEVSAVSDALENFAPRVYQEQMEKGRVWLLKNSLKKNGQPRKNAFIEGWRVAVVQEAVELPRFEADEFAAAFVATAKTREGDVRLTSGPDAHGDLAHTYTVTCKNGKLAVKVGPGSGYPFSD